MQNSLTSKEFEKKIKELVQQIRDCTTAFVDDTPEKQRKRKDAALADFFLFKTTYFPHYATKPSGKVHQEWHELSEKTDCITAIAGPRKHGKTVDMGIIKPIWIALREELHFACFVSADRELAVERTAAIRANLVHNKRLLHDFGEQVGEMDSDYDFVLAIGCRMLAMGWKQTIRGKIWGKYRPEYIFVDDFEDGKSTNRRIALAKVSYIRGDAYGALPDSGGRLIWVGNNTNQISALNFFKTICEESKSSKLIFRTYQALQPDGTPLWPEGFTKEALEDMRETMGEVEFLKNMQNVTVVDGEIFKHQWYKYFSRTGYKPTGKILTRVDPALGQKKSDYQAIITVEQVSSMQYRVLDCWIRREPVLDMLRYLYELERKFETRIFMETNFWQVLLMDYLDAVSEEYGYLVPVTGINTVTNKQNDILKLQPLYQRGKIEHYAPKDSDITLLEEQLGAFDPELSASNRIKDDGPDALARCILQFKYDSFKQDYRSGSKRTLSHLKNIF
jgi:hypothetical protein